MTRLVGDRISVFTPLLFLPDSVSPLLLILADRSGHLQEDPWFRKPSSGLSGFSQGTLDRFPDFSSRQPLVGKYERK